MYNFNKNTFSSTLAGSEAAQGGLEAGLNHNISYIKKGDRGCRAPLFFFKHYLTSVEGLLKKINIYQRRGRRKLKHPIKTRRKHLRQSHN